MSDYWIGDWIKIISSGKIGKFEGEVNKKAKIKTDKKVILVSIDDIELLDENLNPENTENNILFGVEKESYKPYTPFVNSLDLHIEKLSPKMKNERTELILNYQIKRARQYIEEAIDRKQLTITIIHGKGIGALKMEIEYLLNAFSEVYFVKSVNKGGALEITFRY